MQVGRVILILPDTQIDILLQVLKDANKPDLVKTVESARKTVFIDDFRPDKTSCIGQIS